MNDDVSHYEDPRCTRNRAAILAFINANPACSIQQIVAGVGMSRKTASQHIRHLTVFEVISDDVLCGERCRRFWAEAA